METLSDAEVLQSLTHMLRRATGTEHVQPALPRAPGGLTPEPAPDFLTAKRGAGLWEWPS